MAIHTVAWYNKEFDTTTSGTRPKPFATVPAVPDQTLGISGSNLVPSVELSLVAGAAVGYAQTAVTGEESLLVSARLQTPKTLVSPVYLQPVNGGSATFPDNPNLCWLNGNPVQFRADEEIAASAWVERVDVPSPAVAPVTIAAWFRDKMEPIPAGDSYWVAFSVDVDVTAKTWSSAKTFTFLDQTTLPAGRYAILGMQIYPADSDNPAKALVGRLVIPNEVMRPGALVLPSASARVPPMAYDGSLGVWGRFNAQQPLSMEILGAATTSDSKYYGYLHVVQQDR